VTKTFFTNQYIILNFIRVILETDAQAVVARCAVKPDEVAFGEQSISQVGMSLLGSAKDQFKWSLLK
jgi:hypothetical protein